MYDNVYSVYYYKNSLTYDRLSEAVNSRLKSRECTAYLFKNQPLVYKVVCENLNSSKYSKMSFSHAMIRVYKIERGGVVIMKDQVILEAALTERQEYLEDLINSYNLIQEQIAILENDIDKLLFKLMEQSK